VFVFRGEVNGEMVAIGTTVSRRQQTPDHCLSETFTRLYVVGAIPTHTHTHTNTQTHTNTHMHTIEYSTVLYCKGNDDDHNNDRNPNPPLTVTKHGRDYDEQYGIQ
jgi:hypothetical protein